jgi:flagellar basal body-associated protein FliL
MGEWKLLNSRGEGSKKKIYLIVALAIFATLIIVTYFLFSSKSSDA